MMNISPQLFDLIAFASANSAYLDVYCLWSMDWQNEEEQKNKRVACVLFTRTAAHICCSLVKVILSLSSLSRAKECNYTIELEE